MRYHKFVPDLPSESGEAQRESNWRRHLEALSDWKMLVVLLGKPAGILA